MQVLQEYPSHLSNIEVYSLLKNNLNKFKNKDHLGKDTYAYSLNHIKTSQNILSFLAMKTKTRDVLRNLRRADTGEEEVDDKYQKVKDTSYDVINSQKLKEFLEAINFYPLTSQERLQILNTVPTSLVEIHLVVDNCTERLSEEQTLEILSLVKEYLLPQSSFNPNPATEEIKHEKEEKKEEDKGDPEKKEEDKGDPEKKLPTDSK